MDSPVVYGKVVFCKILVIVAIMVTSRLFCAIFSPKNNFKKFCSLVWLHCTLLKVYKNDILDELKRL